MSKKLKIFVIAFVAAVLMLGHGTVEAADQTEQIVKQGVSPSDKTLCYVGYDTSWYYAAFRTEGVSVLSITSSDESVCKVEAEYDEDYKETTVHYKYLKAGKATITAVHTYNGKSYTSKARIKIVPYTSPFKSLKIGSKNVNKIFDISKAHIQGGYSTGYMKFSGKKAVNYKLKKGYKMYQDPTIYTVSSFKKNIKFKKNKKIDLSKVYGIHFFVKDKEGYKFDFSWENKEKR
jgi:hypothetical protein